MRKELSKKQKAVICQLAAKAYKKLIDQGYPMSESINDWRRSELKTACGLGSLTQMGQEHYTFCCNHFKQFIGMIPQQDKTYDPRETQLRYIKDTIGKFDLDKAYVMEIMRDKFGTVKTSVLTEEQLKHLNYTLISRGRTRAKKESDALGVDRPSEPHRYPETMPPGRLADYFGAELVERDEEVPDFLRKESDAIPTHY